MRKEFLESPQEIPSLLVYPTLLTLRRIAKEVALMPLWVIMGSAFSTAVRQKIIQRDGRKCTNCGSTQHLEAAHIDHDKNSPWYNDPDNGRTLCTVCHLTDHILNEGNNGLPIPVNDWAIKKIEERVDRLWS